MKTFPILLFLQAFFSAFAVAQEPRFYLHDNGITVQCENCAPGDTGTVKRVTYEAVDYLLLIQRKEEGADLSKLCTSLVTGMSRLFYGESDFNQNISSWDVSNVVSMGGMFAYASIFNQDIGSWDVSKVRSFSETFPGIPGMFDHATSFNQDIGGWDVSYATSMENMFRGASSFSQDLSSWCVHNFSQEPGGFADESGLQSDDHPKWGEACLNHEVPEFYKEVVVRGSDTLGFTIKCEKCVPGDTGVVEGKTYMAVKEGSLQRGVLSSEDPNSFCTSLVTDMSGLIQHAEFNKAIGTWDVSHVTDMAGMFNGAESFNQDIGSWDVAQVTDMSGMFLDAKSFNQDIGGWDVGETTNMEVMFANASAFNQNIGSWNVSRVTDMSGMFFGAESFNQDIGSWDVSNATDMGAMFAYASAFNQDIGSWDVSQVRYFYNGEPWFSGGMFSAAYAFNQDIGLWDVSHAESMDYMFADAESFNHDLSGWCVELIHESPADFAGGSNLQEDYYPVWGTCNSALETEHLTHVEDILVYPNPLQNMVSIELSAPTKVLTATVWSGSGQMISRNTCYNTNRISLDLMVPNGVYLLTIQNGERIAGRFRLVKTE